MQIPTEESVLGDFNNATLEHHGVNSTMFRRGGTFMVNTEGEDGEMHDFEIKFVFGVDPLQQYLVEFDRAKVQPENEVARLQVLRISWDTKNSRWFHLDPPDVHEKLEPEDDLREALLDVADEDTGRLWVQLLDRGLEHRGHGCAAWRGCGLRCSSW